MHTVAEQFYKKILSKISDEVKLSILSDSGNPSQNFKTIVQ